MKIFLPFCVLCLVLSISVSGFQSDELAEEEEEGTPAAPAAVALEKPAPVLRQSVGHSAEGLRSSGAFPDGPAIDKKIEFPFEHAFGSSGFTPAGVFSARLRSTSQGGQAFSKFRIVRHPFTEKEQKEFEELLKTDGFYKVRLPANVVNPGNTYVHSSVKARCMSAGNFRERFDLHMDQGYVVGLSYGPTTECPYPRPVVYKQWPKESHPLIVVKSSEQATRLMTVIQEVSPIGEGGLEGEELKPPKTFWQKYWMYLIGIGMLLINMYATLPNPESGAGQGGAAAATSQGTQQRISGATAARRR